MLHARLALALLICATTQLHAQTEPAPSKRWSVGLNTGAGLAFRTLSKTENFPVSDVIIQRRNDREEPRLAFGLSGVVGYKLSKRFGFEAGLGYHAQGWVERMDLSQLTFGDIIHPRRGFFYVTGDEMPTSYIWHDTFHYAEVSLAATMSLGQGRWSSISTIGVAPSFLIAAKVRTTKEFADGRTVRSSDVSLQEFDHFNLFPFVSTGVAFRSGERWEWRLQPSVRYGAMQIIDAPITAHLYSGSLEVGVRFTL